MIPEALEALIYDRIVDLPDVDELDNEQIHAIAHEAALVLTGYRVAAQVQIGWYGAYGVVPGGMNNDPAPHWVPVWRDLP